MMDSNVEPAKEAKVEYKLTQEELDLYGGEEMRMGKACVGFIRQYLEDRMAELGDVPKTEDGFIDDTKLNDQQNRILTAVCTMAPVALIHAVVFTEAATDPVLTKLSGAIAHSVYHAMRSEMDRVRNEASRGPHFAGEA